MADTNTVHVGPMASTPNYDVRLVTVESDVAGLKKGLGDLTSTVVTGFEKITTKLEAKTSPNWHLAAIVAPLIISAVAAVWVLFSNYEARVESAFNEQKVAAARFMSREDIVALTNSGKEIADLKMQIVGKDVSRISDDVKLLQSQIVPLSTHQELWAKQGETNKGLASGIDETRKALADITAPKDTISRIYKRLDDVEGLARRGKAD